MVSWGFAFPLSNKGVVVALAGFHEVLQQLFHIGSLSFLSLRPQPGLWAGMVIGSSDSEIIGNVHAVQSDGLAKSLVQSLHSSTSPLLFILGVFYISLSTDLGAGSALAVRGCIGNRSMCCILKVVCELCIINPCPIC